MPGLPDEPALLAGLRARDEAAFMALVEAWSASMTRVALAYVPSRAVAEEVVQEAWLGVLRGIDRFEGRSSLKTWVFRILVNRAKTRGERESRTIPFASLVREDSERDEPSVDPARFRGASEPAPGHWSRPPEPLVADRVEADETLSEIRAAIDALPETQRIVMTLRDVEGLDGPEVAELLGISDGNQRVLLHRARSRVRAALEAAA